MPEIKDTKAPEAPPAPAPAPAPVVAQMVAMTPQDMNAFARGALGIVDDKTPIEPLLRTDDGQPSPPFDINGKAQYDRRRGFDDRIVATLE